MMQSQADQEHKDKKHTNNKNRVRVAIRVRPMINRQSVINQSSCIQYVMHNQIIIGKDRCFTFDHVFNQKTMQVQVYEKCVKQLVIGCFQGYNAAVLAYGQTGSGKTHTMGTGANQMLDQQQLGVVPRVIRQIFEQIEARKQNTSIIVKISFIQIYNQQIIDLLSTNPNLLPSQNLRNVKHSLTKDNINMPTIRQEKDGSISLINVVQETVVDCQQTLSLLHRGGCNRSTSSTLMNDCSSRSHGIFAIHIQQHPIGNQEEGFITAKFYFVDLAGSERAKKTGASGLTLKQGININLGLLELGNVISALSTTQKKQGQFITYRNSKLTRILQDSLGGNSNTYMISCISPAQSNYQQSLNTIKYATKAMNIKNKPIINRDPHSAQINSLKQRIIQLQNENKTIKKLLSQSGISIPQQNLQRNEFRTDILSQQIKKLRNKITQYDKKIQYMQNQIKQKSKKKNELEIQNYQLRRQRDKYKLKIEKTKQHKNIRNGIQQEYQNDQEERLVDQYQNKIRELEAQQFQQEKINNRLQQQYEKLINQVQKSEEIIMLKNKQIFKLKTNLKSVFIQNRKSIAQQSNRNSYSQPMQSSSNGNLNEQNISSQLQKIQQISSEQENVEQIADNQEFIQAEADFRASTHVHNQKLQQMEDQIMQQQQKLQAMTQDQINLQYQLISEMKEQYHQKIAQLQKQKHSLIKQQQDLAFFQKNPKLKQKIQNLQLELRQLRKKAKQQNTLQKQVSMQNQQIKKLANQIKVYKVQKIQINRKIKQDRVAYDKFRRQRVKEILIAKKQNVKKDKQIRKLALQNKRKSMHFKKKAEQLDRCKKVNEAIKSYNRQNKKNIYKKSNPYSHQPKNHKNYQNQQKFQFDPAYELLLSLHKKSMQVIIAKQQIKIQMNKYDKKILQLQSQIEKIIEQQALIQMKLDKLQINQKYKSFDYVDQGQQQDNIMEKQQFRTNIEGLRQRITIIQQNIIYYQLQYNELGSKLPHFIQQSDILHNSTLNTIQKFQTMTKLLYETIRHYVVTSIENNKNIQILSTQNQQLKQQIAQIRQQLGKTITQHQINLARLREEMMAKYYHNLEQMNYSQNGMYGQFIVPSMQHGNKGLGNNLGLKNDQRQKRNYQKKIFDLTKTNRQLSADVEMWRRKCSVVQQKYHNINMRMAKDKFIGRPRQQEMGAKKNTSGWNIGGVNSINSVNTVQMLQQVNQMIDKMQNRKKGMGINEQQQICLPHRNSDDGQFTKNKWECIMTLKASRSPILSMTTYDNLLVTSGTKSINIWDIETCQLVADLSNPNYLQNFVKSVLAIHQNNYIAAACEKQVFIWDIKSYSSVAVLKAHRDQVRCLYSVGNWLFSAGKGTNNSGGLLMWDLRMLENPIQQKQRNIDIFALNSHENTLYYGTRNHQVRRMTLDHRQILSPFEPPHMDTVTSLAVINNYLISGSKDKNLRLWGLDQSVNNIKCTTHAFNDYVNTIQSDKALPIFYAGSRDGQVKVATILDEKIKFIGGIIAHTQAVSSICSVQNNGNRMFLTGSSDKTVKFWKPDLGTSERLNGNFNQNY